MNTILKTTSPFITTIPVTLLRPDHQPIEAKLLCGFGDGTAQIQYLGEDRALHQPLAKRCPKHQVYYLPREWPLGCPKCTSETAQ
jgi:hypothetical protein